MVGIRRWLAVLATFLLIGAAMAEELEGAWSGALKTANGNLRLQINIKKGEDGQYNASLDSPDQGARGIPIRSVTETAGTLVLDVAHIGARYEGQWNADKLQWEGQWSQGGGSLSLTLARGEQAKPTRSQNPIAPFPYEVEEVFFRNPKSGLRLAGTLTLPKGQGPFPAAILISGSGQQDRDETIADHKPFWVIADHLTRQGIAVLRFDDRGVGGSEAGDLKNATSADFATDVDAAIGYLESLTPIAGKKIGLIGHSEGGTIASIVAARPRSPVAFVVLLAAPGVPGEAILQAQSRMMGKAAGQSAEQLDRLAELNTEIYTLIKQEPDAQLRREKIRPLMSTAIRTAGMPESVVESQLQVTSSEWLRFFLMYNPAADFKKIRCPVLALNGEKDVQVSADENLAGIKQGLSGNPSVEVRKMMGLNHLFQSAVTGAPGEYARNSETFSPEALRVIAEWISGRVK